MIIPAVGDKVGWGSGSGSGSGSRLLGIVCGLMSEDDGCYGHSTTLHSALGLDWTGLELESADLT